MQKNLHFPRKSLSFRNLFRFFGREGVGFELGSDGIGQRWDYENFDIAMQRFGKGVGDSTVEAWYAETQVPLNNNMNALGELLGTANPSL